MRVVISALVVLLVIGTGNPAWAYLDPGTGSMILQIVLGGVAGALVAGRLYWQKIKGVFSRRKPAPGKSSDAEPRRDG